MADLGGADLLGPESPPRRNGEIIFEAPWERRVFGLAVALCRSGTIGWEDFRQRLIGAIGDDETRPYWQSWTLALEGALAGAEVLTATELDVRHQDVLARPPGHGSPRHGNHLDDTPGAVAVVSVSAERAASTRQ